MNYSTRTQGQGKQRWQLPSALWTLLVLGLTQASNADNYTIVPGHSIGKVWLGAKRATVHKLLGEPATTQQRKDKLIEDIWKLPEQPVTPEQKNYYKAIYHRNRVVQVETSSPAFSTWGLSLRSNPYAIRTRFRRMRISLTDATWSKPELTRYYYDNRRRGIAFTVAVQGWQQVAKQFDTVIVHRKQYKFVPHKGERILRRYWDEAANQPHRAKATTTVKHKHQSSRGQRP